MKTSIGIVTKGRSSSLIRLVTCLVKQLTPHDSIIIVENGSQELSNKLLKNFFHTSSIQLIHQEQASIPKARNKIFRMVKNKNDLLIYVDDDCIPQQEWLTRIKSTLMHRKNIFMLQGFVVSKPTNNLYAKISSILFNLWINNNVKSDKTITIMDTKNIGIKLQPFRHDPYLFDETLPYASDIDLAARLADRGIHNVFNDSIIVYHEERKTMISFILHRFRVSKSFRYVSRKYPGYFKTTPLLQKYSIVWEKASNNLFVKFYAITCLSISYLLVIFFEFFEYVTHILTKFFFRKTQRYSPATSG